MQHQQTYVLSQYLTIL